MLSSLTTLYVTRSILRRSKTPKVATATIAEAEESEASEGEEKEDEEEIEQAHSKEAILAERRRIIKEIENERGTKVITLIHRKEPWSKSDEDPEIVLEDSEYILQQFRETPQDKPIDFIIHTGGGLAFAGEMMAMAAKYHKGKVTAMVPFYALSEGSLVALAADEIMMERYSILGSVDPLLEDMPAAAIMSAVKRKPIQAVTDKMLLLSDQARMELEKSKAFVKWLLSDKMDENKSGQVAEFLAGGYMSSATPITLDVARALGLNVVEGIPEKVYSIFHTVEFSGHRPGKAFTE